MFSKSWRKHAPHVFNVFANGCEKNKPEKILREKGGMEMLHGSPKNSTMSFTCLGVTR
jgi:hypothetical protein